MSTSQKYLFAAIVVGLLGFFYYQHQIRNSGTTEQAQSLEQQAPAAPALPKTDAQSAGSTTETAASSAATTAVSSEIADTNKDSQVMTEEKRQRVYSEIKFHLAALYTAEKAFYAEYNRYTSDLKAIGWFPDAGDLDIKYGFAEPSVGAVTEGEAPEENMDSDYLLKNPTTDGSFSYSKWAQGLSLKNLSGQCRNGCRAAEHRFEIMAVSRTGPKGEPEVWVINDDKEIIKLTDTATE